MTSQPSPTDSSRSSVSRSDPTRWWVVAVIALLLIGAGFLIGELRSHSDPMSGHPSLSSTAGKTTAAEAKARPAVAADLVPVSLRIPVLGVSVSLSALGLNADKSPQVPTNYEQPGWYKLGPAPGQVGSAVILGHVDDKKGPAVFYRLQTLKAGDKGRREPDRRIGRPFRGQDRGDVFEGEVPVSEGVRLARIQRSTAGHLRREVRQ